MISHEMEALIKKLSEGKITEAEFKSKVRDLQKMNGGNEYTIRNSPEKALEIYNESFSKKVRQLIDEAFDD
jgi:hypothetical protein